MAELCVDIGRDRLPREWRTGSRKADSDAQRLRSSAPRTPQLRRGKGEVSSIKQMKSHRMRSVHRPIQSIACIRWGGETPGNYAITPFQTRGRVKLGSVFSGTSCRTAEVRAARNAQRAREYDGQEYPLERNVRNGPKRRRACAKHIASAYFD